MKLLMIHATRFAYRTGDRSLEEANADHNEGAVEEALIGFIHAESGDEEQPGKMETKLVKNLKWGARKNATQRIVLHSFSHLAETRASPDFTKALLTRAEARLRKAGYEATQTPFGYFLDLELFAPGRSTARIFTSF